MIVDSHSFKIVRKFYLLHPALLLVMQTNLKSFVILPLALFYHLSLIIADQNVLIHGQLGIFTGQISISVCVMLGIATCLRGDYV